MAQEKVKFPVYSFQNECCIVFIALIVFVASVTGTGDDELPLSDALIASLILLLGITFCLFYKLGFSRCLLYTSPSPRDKRQSRMPSSA